MTVDTSNPGKLRLNRMPEAERDATLAAWLRGEDIQRMHAGEWRPDTLLCPMDIIRVKPQPKPVVRWANVYSNRCTGGFKSRDEADFLAKSNRTHVLKITLTEGQKPTAEFIPV